jgi:hypothetical protein
VCSVDFDDCDYEVGLLAGYMLHSGRLKKALLQGPVGGAVDLEVLGPEASALDLEVQVVVDVVNRHSVISFFLFFRFIIVDEPLESVS